MQPISRIERTVLTYTAKILAMEQRLESLEHFNNQQSILVDTLGNIMEELKKQER